MNALTIYEILRKKKGQHVQVVWAKKAKTLRDCAMTITKRTAAWVRSGIDFANLANVKEGIEEGSRAPVGKLPFGHWRNGFEKYIIDHTPKGEIENVEYIRLYPPTFENLQHPKVEWLMDGVVATYEEVLPYLLASEKRKDEKPDCFTLRAESVICIAGE